MVLIARIEDPATDHFVTNEGTPASSFFCETCEPYFEAASHLRVVVSDGFNKWQRCAGCGELIFTTHQVAA